MGRNKRYKRKASKIRGKCLNLVRNTEILDCSCVGCPYSTIMDECKFEYKPKYGNIRDLEKMIKYKRVQL